VEVLRRAAARMRSASVRVFESLDIWDICALIAGSRGYCGSSLHGRIVAMAFGLPRVNLRHPVAAPAASKMLAYARTWEPEDLPTVVAIDEIASALREA